MKWCKEEANVGRPVAEIRRLKEALTALQLSADSLQCGCNQNDPDVIAVRLDIDKADVALLGREKTKDAMDNQQVLQEGVTLAEDIVRHLVYAMGRAADGRRRVVVDGEMYQVTYSASRVRAGRGVKDALSDHPQGT